MKKQLFLSAIAILMAGLSFAQNYGWKVIDPDKFPDISDFYNVFFINDDIGWFTADFTNGLDDHRILKTEDGCATFASYDTPTDAYAIYMLNENIGYAGGIRLYLMKTTNGGKDWTIACHYSDQGYIFDISFPPNADTNNPVGYAGIDFSPVKIINDSLFLLERIIISDYKSVFATSDTTMWTCAFSKVIHYANNDTPSEITVPDGVFNGMYFLSDLEGWIVGNEGIILHTSDGGTTWEIQPLIHYPDLRDVFFLDENEGWIVGKSGSIFHTTDGGDNWILEAPDLTEKDLYSVFFTSPHNGYAVGLDKTLLKYTEISGVDDKLSNLQFKLLPNPAVGEFKVWSSGFRVSRATLELFSFDGRKLLEKPIPKGSEEVTVDVHGLESGLYFCRITTAEGSVTKKVVIK